MTGAHAARQAEALDARLKQAVTAIGHLTDHKQGKKILDAEALQAAAQRLLEHQCVTGLVQIAIETPTQQTTKRKYGGREAEVRGESRSTIRAQIETEAVAAAKQRLGWRVYATNQGGWSWGP